MHAAVCFAVQFSLHPGRAIRLIVSVLSGRLLILSASYTHSTVFTSPVGYPFAIYHLVRTHGYRFQIRLIAIDPCLKAHVRYRFPQFGYAAADNNRLINILRLTIHICFIFGIRIIFQFQPPAVALQYIAALIGNSCLYNLRFRGIQCQRYSVSAFYAVPPDHPYPALWNPTYTLHNCRETDLHNPQYPPPSAPRAAVPAGVRHAPMVTSQNARKPAPIRVKKLQKVLRLVFISVHLQLVAALYHGLDAVRVLSQCPAQLFDVPVDHAVRAVKIPAPRKIQAARHASARGFCAPSAPAAKQIPWAAGRCACRPLLQSPVPGQVTGNPLSAYSRH